MKHALLVLLLCFGVTSFAYAQEDVRLTANRVDAQKVAPARVQQIQADRAELLKTKQQALDMRAEKKQELKADAEATKTDLRARFSAATSTEAREVIRDEAATKRAEFQNTAQEAREEWRSQVKIFFKNRLEAIFAHFANFIEKAQSAEDRIATVLDTLSLRGIDTASVQVELDQAGVLIDSVQEKMRTIRASLESVVETGTQEEVRAAFKEAKEELKEAQRELRAAYAEVRAAIAELKILVQENRETDTEEDNEESTEVETDESSEEQI